MLDITQTISIENYLPIGETIPSLMQEREGVPTETIFPTTGCKVLITTIENNFSFIDI